MNHVKVANAATARLIMVWRWAVRGEAIYAICATARE